MTMTIENERGDLAALLQKVQSQAQASQDLLAPTNQLQLATVDRGDGTKVSKVILEQTGGMPTQILTANSVAFDHIAQKAAIDVRTARRLQQDYSGEWDSLINAIWLKEAKVHMLRTFAEGPNTGTLRGVVSEKFKTFDNHHLLEATLPQLMESDAQWQVQNATVTERAMYVRLKSNVITGEGAAVGDTMALGVMMKNSEIGDSAIVLGQMFWTLVCLNGMQTANTLRQNHITSARGDADQAKILTDEAKDADNRATQLKFRDNCAHLASRESFDEMLEKMKAAGEDRVEGSPNAAVEALGSVMKLTKAETSSVLDGLLQTMGQAGYAGQPLSRATMVNAVTAVAHNTASDNVDTWQLRGSRVLDLPRSDWQRIATAA